MKLLKDWSLTLSWNFRLINANLSEKIVGKQIELLTL